jgi:hypothetical protein
MQVKITASGRNFSQAVKYLKKIGGQFDGGLWTVADGKIDSHDCDTWGLAIVSQSAAPVADVYRDWSDNPNSKY